MLTMLDQNIFDNVFVLKVLIKLMESTYCFNTKSSHYTMNNIVFPFQHNPSRSTLNAHETLSTFYRISIKKAHVFFIYKYNNNNTSIESLFFW